jgi:hypothetical protein
VDYHVYDLPDGTKRIALLNTDWTMPENCKEVVIHSTGNLIPVTVKEGSLTNVLVDKNLVIICAVPGAGARIVGSTDKQIALILSGCGKQVFIVNSDKFFTLRNSNDKSIILKGSNLTIDFDNQWNEKSVLLDF